MGLSVFLFGGAALMAQNGNGNSPRNAYVVGQSLPYGTISTNLTVRILKPATDIEFFPMLGLNLGQVFQTYRLGELEMEYIGKNAVEVRLRGCITIIVISDDI